MSVISAKGMKRESIEYRYHAERGVAVVVLLFAISAFSAAAVMVLTSRAGNPFEAFHYVLHEGEYKFVMPLSVPGSWRLAPEGRPLNFQLRAPVAEGVDVGVNPRSGTWDYSVNIVPGLRVCCDGGDNACHLPLGDGSESTSTFNLQMAASPGSLPANIEGIGDAVAEHHVVTASPVSSLAKTDLGGHTVACGMLLRETLVARGVVHLEADTSGEGAIVPSQTRGSVVVVIRR